MKKVKSKRYKKIFESSKDRSFQSIEDATKIICGSARSMGIEVKE